MTSNSVRLLLGTEHACGYLPDRSARSAFIDPEFPLNAPRYGVLLDLGFRRSGAYVYRPACSSCRDCLAARVPVVQFEPDRSQRRCLKRNADLKLVREPILGEEHYALYRAYLASRHAGGGMNPEDYKAFRTFLECAWGDTQYWSLRLAGRLLAVAVVDLVPTGISAVYTFFDPEERGRGLGTLAVLKQIEQARSLNKPYVYLGYWVANSQKMDYKRRFRPLEVLTKDTWRRLDDIEAADAIAHNCASFERR
jgi:leucyl-tRNA---protein transferase